MLARELSSLQHPIVKHLSNLRTCRSYRYEERSVLVTGTNLLKELAAEHTFKTLLVETGYTPPFPCPAEKIFSVSAPMLKKITGVHSPEPIAAELTMSTPASFDQINFLLVLDGISDPGNLGTLLRTALALGWEGVFITTGSTDPYNDKALRAAKGATFKLPWKQGELKELMTLLEGKKMTLFAADAQGKDIAAIAPRPPFALALGNEAHGLDNALLSLAECVAVPMRGPMESLNVAGAGAILMYILKGKR